VEQPHKHFCAYKLNTHPLKPVIEAVGLTVSSSENSTTVKPPPQVIKLINCYPFLDTAAVLTWPSFEDIKKEMDIGDVNKLFDANIMEVKAKVDSWGRKVVKGLARQLISEREKPSSGHKRCDAKVSTPSMRLRYVIHACTA
jgi:hypothetical protein